MALGMAKVHVSCLPVIQVMSLSLSLSVLFHQTGYCLTSTSASDPSASRPLFPTDPGNES